MISIFRFIRYRLQELRKKWVIEITYPKKYPNGVFLSLIPFNTITSSHGLFIERGVEIKNPDILIGNHTYIGNHTVIDSCKRIGAFCSISSNVKIGMRNHPYDHISTSPVFYSKYRKWLNESTFNESNFKHVIIEEDVLISANVIILNGVTIGRGAIIGAGAVVTKDVEPYSIVAGIPAKKLRMRFTPELIEKIEDSKWWEKDDTLLKKNIQYSSSPEKFISQLK